eukprot:jgi/Undpi1/4900/HiC_scaffold_19.g08252.m1
MAPFPYLPMMAIMASLVSSMVVQMSVYAYAGYMVEHLGVVDDKDEAGYYAGLMSSSFMIGRLLSSHLWGIAGDRLGQRFVLVFGIVSTTILSVVFGCSTTFAVAFTSRIEVLTELTCVRWTGVSYKIMPYELIVSRKETGKKGKKCRPTTSTLLRWLL